MFTGEPNKQLALKPRSYGGTEMRRCGIGWDGMFQPPLGYGYGYLWDMKIGNSGGMAGEAPASFSRE